MGNEAKRQYLNRIRLRYQNASKSAKSTILNEFCLVCGYHRKYAIRLLTKGAIARKRPPGRKRRYGNDLIAHIKELWFAMEQINGKRMKRSKHRPLRKGWF